MVSYIRTIFKRLSLSNSPKVNDNNLYYQLFTHAWDAIFLLEDGTFVECNPKTLEVFGCRKDQIIGQSPVVFSPETQPDGENSKLKAQRLIKDALSGTPQNFDWLHMRIDGSFFDAEVSLIRVEYQGKAFLQANLRDVTQQNLDKQQLIEKKENFEILTNSNIYATFVSTIDGSGKILFANEAALRFLAVPHDQLHTIRTYDFFVDLNVRKAYLQELNEKKSISQREIQIWSNGEIIDIIASSNILTYKGELCAMNIFIDVTQWRKAEKALRQSEEKYRYIVENAPIGIYTRIVGDKYSYANPTFCLDSKCSSLDELNERYGNYDLELANPEIAKELYDALLRDKCINDIELATFLVDGDLRWFSLTAKLAEDGHELYGFALNITERKKAEEALRASEKRFFDAIAFLPIPIRISEKNSVAYINLKFTEVFGYSLEDISNIEEWMQKAYPDKHYRETIHAQWVHDMDVAIKKGISTPTTVFQITGKNGKVKWVEVTSRSIGESNITIFNDITERRKSEIKLRESEERFRLVATLSGHIVYEYLADGDHLNWGGAIKQVTGYSSNEFADFNMNEWEMNVHPEDRAIASSLFRDAIANNKPFHIEYRFKHKSGKYIWIEEECFALTIVKGHVQKAVGVMKDITASKNVERQILSRVIETEERERMHFSQELHDGLGPILSAIKMYIQWLEKPNANIDHSEILEDINNLLNESSQTVRDISFKLSPHILQNYGLVEAIKAYTEKIKESKKINFLLETTPFNARLNDTEEAVVYRVICECITNTVKHAEASQINISIGCDEDIFKITYSDNGKGFNVSEILATPKGIGLLNMQSRMKSINGRMALTSQIGLGTTITFKIDGICNKNTVTS